MERNWRGTEGHMLSPVVRDAWRQKQEEKEKERAKQADGRLPAAASRHS